MRKDHGSMPGRQSRLQVWKPLEVREPPGSEEKLTNGSCGPERYMRPTSPVHATRANARGLGHADPKMEAVRHAGHLSPPARAERARPRRCPASLGRCISDISSVYCQSRVFLLTSARSTGQILRAAVRTCDTPCSNRSLDVSVKSGTGSAAPGQSCLGLAGCPAGPSTSESVPSH